jgi:hypothetical protein
MNSVKKNFSTDSNFKALWIMIAVAIVVFVGLSPLFFFSSSDGHSLAAFPLGWLLGSAVEILAFLTMIHVSVSLLDSKNGNDAVAIKSVVYSLLRLFLWTIVLVFSAICTFKSEWIGGFYWFSFYTVAAASLPMLFIVLATQFHFLRKKEKVEERK